MSVLFDNLYYNIEIDKNYSVFKISSIIDSPIKYINNKASIYMYNVH